MSNLDKYFIGEYKDIVLTMIDENGTVVDISTATATSIIFKSKAGVSTTKTGSFYTNGTDGKVKYRTTSSDTWLTAGVWQVYAKLTLPSSVVLISDKAKFEVEAP